MLNVLSRMERDDWLESRRRAKVKIYQQYWYDKLLESEPKVWDEGHRKPDDFHKWIAKRGKTRWRFMMFTISPRVECMDILIKQTKKCITKKWIKDYLYCYEWNKQGINHVHLWVELNKEKNKVYRCVGEVRNTYKKCGDVNVNVRYSNDPEAFKNYVKGLKKDKKTGELLPKDGSLIDMNNRKKYELKSWYSKN